MKIAHRAFLLAALLAVSITFTVTASGDAGAGQSIQLATLADAWIASSTPGRTFERDGQLQFAVEWLPQADIQHPDTVIYCPEVTQQIVLKFDLTEIEFEIDKARLTLRPNQYNSATPQTSPPLPTLAASLDNWTETDIAWETRPEVHTRLATSASFQSGEIVWLDNGEADTTLAEWLEYRRQSNDTVTLMLDVPVIGNCWPYPLESAALNGSFADSSADAAPMLEIGSAESSLSTTAPTAITLNQSSIYGPDSRTLLLVALLVAFGTLYLGYMDE